MSQCSNIQRSETGLCRQRPTEKFTYSNGTGVWSIKLLCLSSPALTCLDHTHLKNKVFQYLIISYLLNLSWFPIAIYVFSLQMWKNLVWQESVVKAEGAFQQVSTVRFIKDFEWESWFSNFLLFSLHSRWRLKWL